MARFTVRELSRMQRGAYPYNQVPADDPEQEWGKRPHGSWTASEKAVVWFVGIMVLSVAVPLLELMFS